MGVSSQGLVLEFLRRWELCVPGVAKLGPLLLVPLCGRDSVFENVVNPENSRLEMTRPVS